MEKNAVICKSINNKSIFYNKELDLIYDTCNDTPTYLSVDMRYIRTFNDEIYDTIYEITTKCNQKCENCFAECGEQNVEEMDFEYINNDIAIKEKHRIRIAITGGEPFLYSKLNELLSLPSNFNDLNFVINSNGNFDMKDEVLELIIKNKWLVSFSIHGNERAHNEYTRAEGFKKVIENIKKISGKTNLHIYSVFNRYMDKKDLEFIIKLKSEYDIGFIRFITPRNFGRIDMTYNKNLLDFLVDEIKNEKLIGIKDEKSMSELINVNKVSRLSR